MSHFITAVFTRPGQDMDKLLAPFNEQDEAFMSFQPTDYTLEELQKEYKEKKDEYNFTTFEDFMEHYFGYIQNDDGQWGYMTNPNAKWDSYQEGGRWKGFFHLKDGTRANEAEVCEIDFGASMLPWAFLTADGKWFEKGKMGWWGMNDANKSSRETFEEAFNRYVQDHPHRIVTAIDCHI